MDLFLLLYPSSLTRSLDLLFLLEGLAKTKEGLVCETVEIDLKGWDDGVKFYLGLCLGSLAEELDPQAEVQIIEDSVCDPFIWQILRQTIL